MYHHVFFSALNLIKVGLPAKTENEIVPGINNNGTHRDDIKQPLRMSK